MRCRVRRALTDQEQEKRAEFDRVRALRRQDPKKLAEADLIFLVSHLTREGADYTIGQISSMLCIDSNVLSALVSKHPRLRNEWRLVPAKRRAQRRSGCAYLVR